jgi:biotin carboxylase
VVQGIATTIPLHQQIMEDEEFVRGDITTRFMEGFLERYREPAP